MADFTSEFWSVYVSMLTLLGIAGCAILLWAQSKAKVVVSTEDKMETTGHTWDEGLAELNNPMPRWWMWMFYITIVFGLGYLALYPGLGSYAGKLGWRSTGAYEEELKKADQEYGPIFAKYQKMDLKAVAADPQAHAIGERLFLTYCAQCHGSDARGNKGFPNLTDNDWLYGGAPETIEATILGGRNGMMPPMGAAVGSAKDVENVANYVLSLSNSAHDPIKAAFGKEKFVACAACHGPDGKGNQAIGSANLTDKIWLYGGSKETIMETINKGRTNTMPTFKEFLGEAKVHLLAAYVWSLSNEKSTVAQK
ncbi:MAG TPA: cytochrome-c oxidase, cbb3-type subunit III [Noviherbaspirillum sp.]|uniref:cytochrome-c oxidase, cbb3-type subunit III n=1 Tax=Noviherbaspirillum sp. TaxID=1926288 RepID=UPI002B497B23|nr:cytochrome-c oxidase, cbb3-type subunit III [Noviherbaspirillum sp.]HJV85098.1 cytochrome-c oxidase, cbb3-type subunit III [Noviherbaspirillum sp.]